jgi:hypothetical protein
VTRGLGVGRRLAQGRQKELRGAHVAAAG